MLDNNHRRCLSCGGPFDHPVRWTCSAACQLEAKRAKARRKRQRRYARNPEHFRQKVRRRLMRKRMLRSRACRECGREISHMVGQRRTCPECLAKNRDERRARWQAILQAQAQTRRERREISRQRYCHLPDCGELFIPASSLKQKYCSQECRDEARRRRRRSPHYRDVKYAAQRRRWLKLRGTQIAMERIFPVLAKPARPKRPPKPVKHCKECGKPCPSWRKVYCSDECLLKRYPSQSHSARLINCRARRVGRKCLHCHAPMPSEQSGKYCCRAHMLAANQLRSYANQRERSPEEKARRAKQQHAGYLKAKAISMVAEKLFGPIP